jgi:hypothetical protein
MSTEDPRNETLGHVWVEYKGKYFDAETPNGVNSWKELPWMKEFYAKNNSYPSDIENLNEVGEANLKPYKWKEVDIEGYSVYIRFITDSETQYNVDVTTDTYQGIPILNIEFSAKLKDAEGSSSKIVVNKGEMYRVMATIVDIIKKYLKKSKTKGITYYPSKKSSEDFGTQRDNLYKAFISKAIPGVKFEPIRSELYGDGVVALLPGVVNEADPKKGTGKKPEGSSRRLYTDENPKDTVGIKFKTKEDIVDTLNKTSFKSKPHARQSQVINLIHQRVRAAYGKAKDPEVKARLKRGLDYIESRKEMSKKKTERLRKQKTNENQQTNSDTFDRLEYYKNYFVNVSPSTFDVNTNNEDIIISGINKPYPKEFNDVEDTKQNDSLDLKEVVTVTESFYLNIPKFNQPKTVQQYLIESINEISLSKENAAEINGDLTGGTFTVGDITYEYSIKNVPNPYKNDLGLFYNIQFTPSGEVTSIPKGGKENYIKILSTMYKIIVDFVEAYKPEYIGIASMDNTGDKNYHTIYAALTDNKYNKIPGYFRKDVSLPFNTPEGKGKFVVLKRKDV